MTRAEIHEQYEVDEHGLIRSPGKFEQCPDYAPYFYSWYLEGEGEECEDPNHGDGCLVFDITEEDVAEFPGYDEIAPGETAHLREDDNGFVSVQVEVAGDDD
jgi:hypothetical protein